jgi:hypothetical protein
MRWRNPHLWIAVASALLVTSVALVDVGRTSPGALSSVHLREPDLGGRSGCKQCHGGWTTSMTSACLECHAVIDEQIEAGAGLHGLLGEELASRCARCHSDHHGEGFKLVNLQSFRQAGVDDPDDFPHGLIGWTMNGAHLELGCAECHTNADELVLPKGEHRFLGLDQNCAECHDDPHEGRMVPACAQCHGQESFEVMHSEGHEQFLPLIGGHGEAACRECHAEDTDHSLEILGAGLRDVEPRACLDCHESPHEEGFIANLAGSLGTSPDASCDECHAAEHTSFDEEQIELSAFQHAFTGFALDAPHDETTCAECHAPELASFVARYPGREPESCSACHDDPHGGQFAEGAFAGLECTACHSGQHFEPHAFGLSEHDRTSMPLTGTHADTDCAECHRVPTEGEPRQFRNTPGRCADCHADAHRGFFADLEADRTLDDRGTCAECHITTTFAELPEEGFDHHRWTDFELLGAHAQESCESCHPRAHTPDDTGRSFGVVAEHFGDYSGCVTCHVDPHHGAFDEPELPARVQGRSGCARCHVETSFRSLREGSGGFDHGRWTGFDLSGAHGKQACSTCHEPLARPDELARTWGRAAGDSCADCHADPHAGQFVVEGETDCARCHTEAGSAFSELVFNHTFDSRFPLGESHEQLACSECHPSVLHDEGSIVRYRPLGRDCVDCHGDHQGPLRRRDGRRP